MCRFRNPVGGDLFIATPRLGATKPRRGDLSITFATRNAIMLVEGSGTNIFGFSRSTRSSMARNIYSSRWMEDRTGHPSGVWPTLHRRGYYRQVTPTGFEPCGWGGGCRKETASAVLKPPPGSAPAPAPAQSRTWLTTSWKRLVQFVPGRLVSPIGSDARCSWRIRRTSSMVGGRPWHECGPRTMSSDST